ncbi:MAG: glycosyltransferase family 4 protein, partial [Planctomycetota bacterium]
ALSFPVSAVESRLVSPAAALLPESPPLVPAPKDAGQTRDPEDRHQHGVCCALTCPRYGTVQMAKSKFTFLCQTYYPDTQSTSQLFGDLLGKLAQREHEISVICGYPVVVQDPAQLSVGKYDEHKNISITRCGLRIQNKKNLLLRGLMYLSYVVSGTIQVWKHRKDDFIFGVTNPPFTPVWLWAIQKLFGFKYRIMLLDIFPDGLVALDQMSKGGIVARLWAWANRHAFARADQVLVLGRDMSELIQEKYGVPESKIEYIPHWSSFETSEAIPADQTNMWQQEKLDGKFVVQYSGNMGLWHDMESIVRAAALLKDSPHIQFLFIGEGRRKAGAYKLAQELGCENISWLPFQPKETLKDSLSCCHMAIISQRRVVKGVAVPCKVYGILASGRPILALVPKDSEVEMIVNEEQCGATAEPDDPEGIAAAIRQFAESPEQIVEMGKNSFNAFSEKYTIESAVENFEAAWPTT